MRRLASPLLSTPLYLSSCFSPDVPVVGSEQPTTTEGTEIAGGSSESNDGENNVGDGPSDSGVADGNSEDGTSGQGGPGEGDGATVQDTATGGDTTCVQPGCDDGVTDDAPHLIHPWNGTMTGSIHTATLPAARNALRPRFIWAPIENAVYYQFELSPNCPATGFAECHLDGAVNERIIAPTTEFRPLEPLEVSLTPPVGRRYFFRLRACFADDTCTTFTSIRYVDVGRSAADFDGDGYSETVIGANGGDFSAGLPGRAYILGDGDSAAPVELDNPRPAALDYFGQSSTAAGDLDADGYPDVAIAAPYHSGSGADNAGAVYVFFGSADGLDESRIATLDPATPREDGRFGLSISGMDVDLDGYSDLLVSHGGENVGPVVSAGSVLVYHGQAGGIADAPRERISRDPPESGEEFGSYGIASIGDGNGNGWPELAITIDAIDDTVSGAGAVLIYDGPNIADVQYVITMSPSTISASFGGQVAGGGDMNGDGYADLAIWANDPVDSVRGGSVFLFVGSPSGYIPGPEQVVRSPTFGANNLFGTAIAIDGDLNGDQFDDLVVGEFQGYSGGGDVRSGAAYVFLGNPTDPLRTPSIELVPPRLEQLGYYGRFVGYGDRNGDGLADITVGAARYDTNGVQNAGAAFLFTGDEATIASFLQTIDPPVDATVDFHFGEYGLN